MMDRLSGQFVRKAQALSLFVAVTLTLITNADTISVFKHLSLDPAFAKTFADEAQKFANDNPSAPNAPSLKKIEDAADKLSIPHWLGRRRAFSPVQPTGMVHQNCRPAHNGVGRVAGRAVLV